MYNDFGQYAPQSNGEKALHIFGFALTKSKVVIIILALAVIIETVFLVIFITGNGIIVESETSSDNGYIYDENGHIVAISLLCKSDKSRYMFYETGEYMLESNNGKWEDSGEYTFVGDNTISLYNANKETTLSMNAGLITDGSSTYTCEYLQDAE